MIEPGRYISNETPPSEYYVVGRAAIDPDVFVAYRAGSRSAYWVTETDGTLIGRDINPQDEIKLTKDQSMKDEVFERAMQTAKDDLQKVWDAYEALLEAYYQANDDKKAELRTALGETHGKIGELVAPLTSLIAAQNTL